MAALNFPSNPQEGDTYAPVGVPQSYQYTSGAWQVTGLALNYISRAGDYISGPLLHSDGTVTNPAVSFTSATSTGFFWKTDTVALSLGNSEKFTFKSTSGVGNLGVNVTSPAAEMDVRSSNATSTVRIQSTSGNRFRLTADSASVDTYVENTSAAATTHKFFNGGAEAYRVDTSLRFGIGGTPAAKLDVQSASGTNTIRSYSVAGTDARVVIKNTANESIIGSDATGSYITQASALPFRILTNNTENLRLLSDGSLGVKTDGTTDAKLHVAGAKTSNIAHLQAAVGGTYDGLYLRAETLSGQAGGVIFVPNTTPGVGSSEFTTNFGSNTSGGTVNHNVRVGGNLTVAGTSNVKLTSGTTAQRPVTPADGMVRHNSDTATFEGYAGNWRPLGPYFNSDSNTTAVTNGSVTTVATLTIPAYTLRNNYEYLDFTHAASFYNNSGSDRTLTLDMLLGVASMFGTTTTNIATSATERPCRLTGQLVRLTASTGLLTFQWVIGGAGTFVNAAQTIVAENTSFVASWTIDQTFYIKITQTGYTSSETYTPRIALIKR